MSQNYVEEQLERGVLGIEQEVNQHHEAHSPYQKYENELKEWISHNLHFFKKAEYFLS